jgi:hypothetical protein
MAYAECLKSSSPSSESSGGNYMTLGRMMMVVVWEAVILSGSGPDSAASHLTVLLLIPVLGVQGHNFTKFHFLLRVLT